jgi:hypothetical protein
MPPAFAVEGRVDAATGFELDASLVDETPVFLVLVTLRMSF